MTATHTYASPGVYQTTVAVHDAGGANAQARGAANVITIHDTSTFVGCSPTAVTPGHDTTCTATVSDAGPGTATTPTGTISFSSGGSSKISGGGRCTLSGSRGAASCAVSFTPGRSRSDTPTLTARYGGDFGHTGSSGSTTVSPVAGMTANVAVIQGTVLISIPRHTPHAAGASGPSSSTYVPLKGGGTIPVGSTVDATNGTVMLATAADYHGALDRQHRIHHRGAVGPGPRGNGGGHRARGSPRGAGARSSTWARGRGSGRSARRTRRRAGSDQTPRASSSTTSSSSSRPAWSRRTRPACACCTCYAHPGDADATVMLDETKRKAMYAELQQLQWNEGGYIVWGFQDFTDAYSASTHGWQCSPSRPLGFYGFKHIWLS